MLKVVELRGIPDMAGLAQLFPDRSIRHVDIEVNRVLNEAGLKSLLSPGERVAVTAGSRGIKNIVRIIKAVTDFISSCGCRPFVISAMGSHGGGTAEGQLEVLSGLGITPGEIGVPVLASGSCVPLPPANGEVFYVNSLALEFDRIIVVNRIKPHTSFHGPAESGLQKMLAIGLGGPEGAARIHSLGVEALPSVIPRAAAAVAGRLPVALGLAVLEDSHDHTMSIEALFPGEFPRREADLLEEARRSMPGIPFDSLDVLVVDEIGKVFSGTGMDTNVIGRLRINGLPEPEKPRIKRIVALGLAPGAKGNAYGIGLADFTTRRLVEGIDYDAMYLNAMTSNFVTRAMVPMTYADDLSAIHAAIKSLGLVEPEEIRMIRIKNTLHLDHILVSRALLGEAAAKSAVRITGEPGPMTFDRNNNLLPF